MPQAVEDPPYIQPASKSQVTVGLVQINNSFSGQSYLPYSVGLLQAYVQRWVAQPQRYNFLLPIYRRLAIHEMVKTIKTADVIGFSVYMWNIKLSLALAHNIKKQNPQTLIVFGGPNVPDKVARFLDDNPFIDICCHGEGEEVFLQILETYPSNNWQNIPGISYKNSDGLLVSNPRKNRLRDLDKIPSPYLDGVFTTLMQSFADEIWLALWETNRGCPFSCSFCDWGSAVGSKVYKFAMPRLLQEIDWFARNRIEFVFCCDANFGILGRDIDLVREAEASKKRYGYPNALSVQNTKNSTNRTFDIQKILFDSGLGKGVSLALQSVDDYTLESINRQNISQDRFLELQHLFHGEGIPTFTDIIIGLPSETLASYKNGVEQVIESGQHNRIQFIHLAILPNSEIGSREYQDKYGMQIVESKLINNHGILTDQEEIQETQELVVGTKDMPAKEWVDACTFSFMTALLYFDKILQIPLVIMQKEGGVGIKKIIDKFCSVSADKYPTIAKVHSFFFEKAKEIQQGGPEFQEAPDWLNIWWPANEYIAIKLLRKKQLATFYQEAKSLLLQLDSTVSDAIINDAINLNYKMFKQPYQFEDITITCRFNIYEYYQSVLSGNSCKLVEKPVTYRVLQSQETWSSWDSWLREVIWFGHKTSSYLYGVSEIEDKKITS
ncbi:MAG: radical SAM protein [Magnetococcales bacterium]|nr:radical SAM protein [Magnetococcales bacterium]